MATVVRFEEMPDWQYRALDSTEGRACLAKVADEFSGRAVSYQPVRTGWEQAYFERGLGVEADTGEEGTPVEYVTTQSSIWHLIEYGSRNNPAYAPLRRAADSLGLKWDGGKG